MNESEMVWVPDRSWVKLQMPRKCSRSSAAKGRCQNTAGFGLIRSNGIWAYCREHMYGRRINGDIVEVEVHPESPAAQRGYFSIYK